MSILHFDETGISEISDSGIITRPVPYPFFLWSFIGFWRPVCVKHRKIFQFSGRYYRNHAYCEGSTFPPSDLAIKSGFRKVWLP